jgi:hypothetical protein
MKKFSLLFVLLFVATAMNLYAQVAPADLQIVDYEYHSVILSATANANNDEIFIAITDVPKKNTYDQIIEGGTFGTPQGNYNIGDEITGGGKVVYKGGTSTNILIEGLDDNVTYHFQAWSRNGAGTYSSGYLEKSFLSWGKVPYVSNYEVLPLGEVPLSWSIQGGDIYMQKTAWGTSWLQQATLNGSPGNPAIMTLTTQWILLDAKRNELSFSYYMAVPTFGSFYAPLTNDPDGDGVPWEEGSSFEIQVSNDDVNFVTVHTVNKDNAHDFVYPRNQANMATLLTPEFDTFKGQKVKVRFKWHFVQTVQTHMENLHVDKVEIGECDGIYDLTAEPRIGGEAEVSWSSFDEDADLWEIRYRDVDGAGDWTEPVETADNPYLLTGLPFETKIEVQVRVVCSPELQSDWGSFIFISAAEFPPCEYPISLNATGITSTSAQLSWEESGEGNLNWDLRYREATTTSWNTENALETKTYSLEELTPNTAYLWSVRAHCTGDQTSNWATQNSFTTEPSGIKGLNKEQMTVFASGKMLNIINPENRYIEKVQLFDITGKLLSDYIVKSTDNVLIPTTLTSEMILFVKIIGQNEVENHKVLLK